MSFEASIAQLNHELDQLGRFDNEYAKIYMASFAPETLRLVFDRVMETDTTPQGVATTACRAALVGERYDISPEGVDRACNLALVRARKEAV